MVGWNSAESSYQGLMGRDTPTVENYKNKLKQLYGERADEALKLYPGANQEEVIRSATALASNRFIAFSTWKWADLQTKTGTKPVYRYWFSHPRPAAVGQTNNSATSTAPKPMVGASHASEIEYALGNLPYNKVYAWTKDDEQVSETMLSYFANFVKTGNPNGGNLPKWTPNTGSNPVYFMNIDVNSQLKPEQDRARYLFLEKEYMK